MGYYSNTLGAGHGSALEDHEAFLVRRRSFPRDAHLIHSTQETFTDVVTSFTVFWYLGLSLVTFNNELHTWTLPALLLTWLGCGLLGSIVVSLVVRFLRKRLE